MEDLCSFFKLKMCQNPYITILLCCFEGFLSRAIVPLFLRLKIISFFCKISRRYYCYSICNNI